jgi:hypothetical protein
MPPGYALRIIPASEPESTARVTSSGLYVLLAVKDIEEAIPEIEYAHLSTDETDPLRVCCAPSPPLPVAKAGAKPVIDAPNTALETMKPVNARARFAMVLVDMALLKTDTSRIAQSGKIASTNPKLGAWFSLL